MAPPSCGPSKEQLAPPGDGSDIVVGDSKSNDNVGDRICCDWCMEGWRDESLASDDEYEGRESGYILGNCECEENVEFRGS